MKELIHVKRLEHCLVHNRGMTHLSCLIIHGKPRRKEVGKGVENREKIGNEKIGA